MWVCWGSRGPAPFRFQITSTRDSGLEGNQPKGCFDEPSRLLSRKIPKLVYRGKETFKSGPVKEEDSTSTATGTLSWKVTLIKGNPNYR
ncbi:MAG TPA: hypothetical protein VF255_08415 [Solirubrobacterales bacterium]